MKRAHAGSYHVAVIYQHPLAYLVGLEGVALLRAFAGEYDRDFTHARLAEIAALLDAGAQFGDGVDVPPITASQGYAAWADTYDQPGNGLIELEQPIIRRIVDQLPPGAAVDAACGTGRHAGYLASTGHTVTGVDACARMLAIARAKVPAAEFREGDLHRLPVPDQHADLVVCALALCHVPDLAPVMTEFARVLRPGGHLLISDTRGMLSQLGTPGDLSFAGQGWLHWVPPGQHFGYVAVRGLVTLAAVGAAWFAPRPGVAAVSLIAVATISLIAVATDAYPWQDPWWLLGEPAMLAALALLALGKERMPRYWLWLLGADLVVQVLTSLPYGRFHALPLFLFPWLNDLTWAVLAAVVAWAVVDARPAIAAGVCAALGRAIPLATGWYDTSFGGDHVFFWPLAWGVMLALVMTLRLRRQAVL